VASNKKSKKKAKMQQKKGKAYTPKNQAYNPITGETKSSFLKNPYANAKETKETPEDGIKQTLNIEIGTIGADKAKKDIDDLSKAENKLSEETKKLKESHSELKEEIQEGVTEAFKELFKETLNLVSGFFTIKKSMSSVLEELVEFNKEWTSLSMRFGGLEGGEKAIHLINHFATELPVARGEVAKMVTHLKGLGFTLGEIETLPFKDLANYALLSGESFSGLVKEMTGLVKNLDYGSVFDFASKMGEMGLLRPGENAAQVASQMMNALKNVKIKPGETIFGNKKALEEMMKVVGDRMKRVSEAAEYSLEGLTTKLKNLGSVLAEAVVGDVRDANSPMRRLVDTVKEMIEWVKNNKDTIHDFFHGLGEIFGVLVKIVKPLAVGFMTVFYVVSKIVGGLAHFLNILEEKIGIVSKFGYILGFVFGLKMLNNMRMFFLTSFKYLGGFGLKMEWFFKALNVLAPNFTKSISIGLTIMQAQIGGAVDAIKKKILSLEIVQKIMDRWKNAPIPAFAMSKKEGVEKGALENMKEAITGKKGKGTPSPTSVATPSSAKNVTSATDKISQINGKGLLQVGAALIAVSVALIGFAYALKLFGELNNVWQSLGLAAVSLLMLGGALYGFMAIMASFTAASAILVPGLLLLLGITVSMIGIAFAFKLMGEALISFGKGLQMISKLNLVDIGKSVLALVGTLGTLSLFGLGTMLGGALGLSIISSKLEDIGDALEDIGEGTNKLKELKALLSGETIGGVGPSVSAVPVSGIGGEGGGNVIYNINISGYIQSIDELKKQLDRLDNRKKIR
jgi:hypothetical protein